MPIVEIPALIAAQLKLIGYVGGAALITAAASGKLSEYTVRGRLKLVFDACSLYTEKREMIIGKHRVYPKIHSVKYGVNGVTAVFSAPFGLNPERIEDSAWAFRQKLGEDVMLKRDGNRFILTVEPRSIPSNVAYNVQEIAELAKEMRLPIVVGRSDNAYEVYDMVDYPHLLIAGETGSGKSTQLRAILTALITSKSPDDLVLYLADMKRSEFHLFRNVSHVSEVVTRINDLRRILDRISVELKRRGDLLDTAEVSHIDDYNALQEEAEREPYIVLCIDEVALLQKEKYAMSIIEEISAIGRALGVFLVLSMQRPDAKVLDGKLKNNLTVRMAFRHADAINSRITIDSGDAADIKAREKGRMIWKCDGMKLVQGPHVTVEEAKRILAPHKVTKGRRSYNGPEHGSPAFDMPGEAEAQDLRYETEIFGLLAGIRK